MKPGRVYLLRVQAPDGTSVPPLFRWTQDPREAWKYQRELAGYGFTVHAIAAQVSDLQAVALE